MRQPRRHLALAAMVAVAFGPYWMPSAEDADVNPEQAAKDTAIPSTAVWGQTDRYGDPLPPGALARLGTVRFRHQARVAAVAFAPAGDTLATVDEAQTLTLWVFPTGKPLRRAGGYWDYRHFHRFGGASLAFRADGRTLVWSYGRGITSIESASLKEGKRFRPKDDLGWDPSVLSPTGRLALVTGHSDLVLWDLDAGRPLHRFPKAADQNEPFSIYRDRFKQTAAFAPDDSRVAVTMANNRILLYERGTGRERPLEGHQGALRCLAFTPDGMRLISAGEFIYVWDLETGIPTRRFPVGPEREVPEMDREALAAWLEDKKPVKEPRLIKVRPRVRSLALAPDGRRLAVYTDERQLMVWDLARARIVWSNAPKEEFPQLLFSPDARYLLGLAAWDGLHAWDAARGRAVHPAAREPKSVWLRAFTPDSTGLWVWTDHNKSERWDLVSDTRTEGQPDPRPRDIAATLESEADKTLGRVLVFDADSRRPLRTFAVPLKQPRHSFGDFERNHVALSEKAKFLVFTTSTQVWCWRLHEPGAEPAWKISLDKDDWDNWRVSGITFAPDESFVAIWRFPIMYTMVGTSADHPVDVRFLDLRTGGELSRFKGLTNRCRWLVFSPDGKAMATNGLHSHHAVHLCDVASGALLHTFATEHSAACAAFLPDGRSLVAGCSDGSLWMWECASGGLRQKWAGHNGLVNTVLASPNGRLLASSCEDGTALVWGVAELIPPADGPWEAERLWTNLGAADAAFAYRAMAALCSRPVQAVNEIRRRLSPIPPGSEARIAAWIAALDSERYREREEATHSLHRHIDLAYPLLCRAAEGPASLETKRRLQRLLQHGGAAADQEKARQRRAVEVLERLGTEPSRQLLQELAHGDPSVPLTRDARQSLQRLRRREVSTARQAP